MIKDFIRKSATVAVLLGCTATQADALRGTFRGDLAVGQIKIPIVFNFTENAEGVTECTLDSPSQGARGIATKIWHCSDDSVAVYCKSVGAKFRGHISGDTISGTFTQRGAVLPLVLTPEEDITVRRPQTPVAPFPYTTVDTVFESTGGARLAATLTLPAGGTTGSTPALVLVSGSGPQNRDEELFEHKPFAVLADFLARKGIATLRYDDRGTASSTGDYASATIDDFKADARNAMALLRGIPGIGRIGVAGHSEGGTIAFMLAAEKVPDFVVSLGGMAVSGKEAIMGQNIHSLDLAGVTGTAKEQSIRLLDRFFDIMINQTRKGTREEIDVDSLAEALGTHEVPAEIIASIKMAQKSRSTEVDALLAIEPSKYMGKVKCPVLAINGERDTQVSAVANIKAIKKYIPSAQTLVAPELNHLLQHCITGEVTEYGEIRETMAPEVLEAIAEFVSGLK